MGPAAADLASVAAVVAAWLAVFVGFRLVGSDPRDPRVQSLALASFFLALRPTVLALHLDSPVPDDLFEGFPPAVGASSTVLVVIWLVVYSISARAFYARPASQAARSVLPSDDRIRRLLPLIALLAVLVTVPFWIRHGGPGGLVQASKGGSVAGAGRLARAPAVVAAYVGAVVGCSASCGAGTRRLGWSLYVIGAAVSYSWGARDAAVFPLLALATRIVRPVNDAVRRRRVDWVAAVTVCAAVAAVGVALRLGRDLALTGSVQSSLRQQSPVRQMSVASNATQFDALMLVVRDTPERFSRGGVAKVLDAVLAPIPGVRTVGGGEFVSPALEVARSYEPRRRNGWPITVVGDWFYALGVAGVAIGAAVSGVVAARIARWRLRLVDRGVAADALTLIWSTTIAPIGLTLTTPARAAAILVPAALVLVALRAFGRVGGLRSMTIRRSVAT